MKTRFEPLSPDALRCFEVRQWRDDETEGFPSLLEENFCLKAPAGRTRRLCQVVTFGERAVALLVWKNAARSLAGLERFIGWDRRTCKKLLGYLVQNNRLASRVVKELILGKPLDGNASVAARSEPYISST